MLFFFFKQKTAYEMRISDWSSDVCSSDLQGTAEGPAAGKEAARCPDAEQRHPAGRGEVMQLRSRLYRRPPLWRALLRWWRTTWSSEERRVGKGCVRTGRSRWSSSQ